MNDYLMFLQMCYEEMFNLIFSIIEFIKGENE